MSLIYMDGFESYGAAAEMTLVGLTNPTKWIYQYNIGPSTHHRTIQVSTASSRSFYMHNTGSLSLSTPSQSEVYVGFGYYPSNTVQTYLLYLGKTQGYVTDGLLLTRHTNGSLSVRLPDTTTTYTSAATGLIPLANWCYIEVGFRLHATTGFIEVRVNGVTVINQTGINTTGSSLTGISMISLMTSSDWNYFDDFYYCDSNGTINNTFLGPSSVYTLLPTGDDSVSFSNAVGGSGTHASCVNEHSPNADTSYVEGTATGQVDYFIMQDIPVTGTVRGVLLSGRVRKADNGVRSVKFSTKVSGVASSAITRDATFASNYTTETGLFEYQPDGTTAWNEAAVNLLQGGIELG